MTQFQLAVNSGVSLPTIQKIESGNSNPGLQVIENILKCLHYGIQYAPLSPNWDLLASYGVPLSSRAKPENSPQRNILLALLKNSLLYYSVESPKPTREWEALAAFLMGLKTHFGDFYDQLGPLKIQVENLIQQQSPARLYKLRRIAISTQAKYL